MLIDIEIVFFLYLHGPRWTPMDPDGPPWTPMDPVGGVGRKGGIGRGIADRKKWAKVRDCIYLYRKKQIPHFCPLLHSGKEGNPWIPKVRGLVVRH